MKTKKSMLSSYFMIILLLVTISAIILIIGTVQFKKNLSNIIDKTSCKQSVRLHKESNIQGVELIKSINCPTENVILAEKDPEKLKKEIADRMWTCWDNFGRGEYELFSAQSEKFCVVCSVIDFKYKQRELTDFSGYLMKTPFPGDSEKTYFEMLSGISTNQAAHNPDPSLIDPTANSEDTISTDDDYAIIFIYAKQSYWGRMKRAGVWGTVGLVTGSVIGIALIATGVGSGAGFAVLAVTGAAAGGAIGGLSTNKNADWQAGLVLIPYTEQEVSNLGCDILPIKQSYQNQNP
jgi:hypothetical protein